MEYRLKYRDIPWGVALGVLPGKIIGTFFIKPWMRAARDWGYTVRRWISRLIFTLLILMMIALILGLIDTATDGGLILRISEFLEMASTATPEPQPVSIPTPVDIRNSH